MLKLTLQPVFGSWLAAIFLVGILFGVVWRFAPARGPVSPNVRRGILFLRGLLFLWFGLILLRPSMIFQESRYLPATLMILIDQSASLSISDELDGATRWDRIRKTLAETESVLEKIGERVEIEAFGFDAALTPREIDHGHIVLSAEPTGTETALGDALVSTLAQGAGKRLLGVILLSDGTQRTRSARGVSPTDAALRCREAHLPVWTVAFGGTEPSAARSDVAVRGLMLPERLFANNGFPIAGQIRVLGYSQKEIPVTVSVEQPDGSMKPVERITVRAETPDQTIPFRFDGKFDAPGLWKVTVSADAQEGELLAQNNRQSDFVEVIDGGVSVLYLEGARRFDPRFLRRALESSAEIRVDYFRFAPNTATRIPGKTETEQIALATPGRLSLADKLFAPGSYAAYILGSADVAFFQPTELAALRQRVAEGAGLILLAGPRSFAAGGYADSLLADIFPVGLNPTGRLPLELDAVPDGGSLPGSFLFTPTEIGARDYRTQISIDPKKSVERWKSLPPLEPIYRVESVKPNAEVLAMGTPTAGGPPVPLLVSQLYGAGRVTLLATDATWQWEMAGFTEEYRRFWRQILLWSAKMDQLREGELVIRLDKKRYAQEEPVEMRVATRLKEGVTSESVTLEISVAGPNGENLPVPVTPDGTGWTATARPTGSEGDYRIHALLKNRQNGTILAESVGRFLVEAENPELDAPAASPAVLAAVAELSGGKGIPPADLPALLGEISETAEMLVDIQEIKRTLYDTWPVFLIFILLITAEWVLRKRSGLV